MKMSVIEVHAMLSALSVDGVGKRFSEVPVRGTSLMFAALQRNRHNCCIDLRVMSTDEGLTIASAVSRIAS